jgi:acetyl esterase/lipase
MNQKSKRISINHILLILLVIFLGHYSFAKKKTINKTGNKKVNKNTKSSYEKADKGKWKEIFSDDCTENWKKLWFLDGEVGTVKNGKDGMTLSAGPEFKNDTHHMVLWTKESFEGDLKIEYDYTRLDDATKCVNILYIQATGSGKGPYAKDISKWNELRKVPSMNKYFNNMNTYHISYAAFPNRGKNRKQYIRGRRYMPHKSGLGGSDLEPEYFPDGLFDKGVKHHITVIKKEKDLFMRVENPDQTYFCHMKNTKLPGITEGRIGLRHMYTRSAVYRNFVISTLENNRASLKKAPGYEGDVPVPNRSEVRYGKHKRHVLDFWQAESDKPTPVVLVIHGGGWSGGSKERLSRFVDINTLLKAGISVAANNYRLMKHCKGVVPPVKAPMHDCARALQFIRSKAEEWNINPDKIGAAGGSAGACTSLWLTYHDDLADPENSDPVLRQSTRLACAAVNGAQTTLDPEQMKKWTPNSKYGGHAFGKKNFTEFLSDREKILPWINEYSPYALATADDPPVAIFYNNPPSMGKEQKDPTHTANFGIGLQKKCERLGIECQVYYPEKGKKKKTATQFLIKNLK